jgi:hypothetical protein
MQSNDIAHAIAGLTDRVFAYRIARIINRGTTMPLEIKGLKGKALKAGGVFDRLNRAYDKLIETGEAHATDVESLPGQIDGMQDDLTFMVQTLGNSVNGSGESEKPAEKRLAQAEGGDLNQAKPAPALPQAAPPPIIGDQRKFDRMGG